MVMVIWAHTRLYIWHELCIWKPLCEHTKQLLLKCHILRHFFKKQMSKECPLKPLKNSSAHILTNLLPKFGFNWHFLHLITIYKRRNASQTIKIPLFYFTLTISYNKIVKSMYFLTNLETLCLWTGTVTFLHRGHSAIKPFLRKPPILRLAEELSEMLFLKNSNNMCSVEQQG